MLGGKKSKILIFFFVLFLIVDLSLILYFFYFSNIPVKKLSAKPGSCKILEEKNCASFKIVANPHTKSGKMAVAKVPRGSYIFSPIDGFISYATYSFYDSGRGKIIKYPSIIIANSNISGEITFMYSFIFNRDSIIGNSTKISKGDVVGTITNNNLDYFGNYNLGVFITQQTLYMKGKPHFIQGGSIIINNETELKKLLKIN